MLNELTSRAEGKGSSVPLTVAQVRTKFKKCISCIHDQDCKRTGVKLFQDDNSNWSTRDSSRPDLATEPLMKVPVTDCNDDVGNEDQDLDKDHPSINP